MAGDTRSDMRPASAGLPPANVSLEKEAAGEAKSRDCGGQLAGLVICIVLAVATGAAVSYYGPTKVVRFILELFPDDPGWEWYLGMGAIILVSIVTLMPFWVPLCMLSGLIFGLVYGALLDFVAILGGAFVSIVIGRWVLQEPIRECIENGDYPKVRRMMVVLEDSENSLKFQVLFRFMFIPMFIRNYGPATLQIPLWKLVVGCVPHSLWVAILYSSLGATFKDAAQLLRDGKHFDFSAMKWQQVVMVCVSLVFAILMAIYAQHKYTEHLEKDDQARPLGEAAAEAAAGARPRSAPRSAGGSSAALEGSAQQGGLP